MTGQATGMTIRKSISVGCRVEHAFVTFTDRIAIWWPLGTHSVGETRARTCVFEGKVGGRLYEVWDDGTECDWGRVSAWEPQPPHRIVFSWRPNPESPAPTEVEVRFAPDGDATRVEVEHRGWERLGERATDAYESYDSGWDGVLSVFGKAAAGAS